MVLRFPSLWASSGDLDHTILEKFDFPILVTEIDQRDLLSGNRGNHS